MYFDENNNYFEMYENEYELENKYNNNFNVKIDNINFNRELSLYEPVEGFNKGNMFSNLYSKYKNYVYKLKVNNEKDELLYKIQVYSFALKDYNLYLDVHPDDSSVLMEYGKVKNKLDLVKSEYENKYGPLCASEVESSSKWTWLDGPWPWDKGGKTNV